MAVDLISSSITVKVGVVIVVVSLEFQFGEREKIGETIQLEQPLRLSLDTKTD